MTRHRSEQRIGRRDFLKIGAATAAAAAFDRIGLRQTRGQTPSPRRPNILFVFSDEHRWCSLPFTESPETIAPNMTRLAQEGLRFDNCCSTSPICVPYRGMLMTGMWPHQSSCISNDYFGNHNIIGLDAPTIAQTFKKAGYTTGYVGKWHLENETVYNAGFDYFKHWLFGDNHWKTPVQDVPSREAFKDQEGYNAIGMTDQALEFMGQQAKGDRPFMLMLSLNPPHYRWDDAPEEFVKLYPQDKLPFRPNVTAARYKQGNELRDYQHYHAHITAVDRELGRLMASLKKLGLEENTVLIYTSDHGSSFGSNSVGSKGNPFDEAIRVPFIVRWPGRVAANKVTDRNLGTMDIYPTLCGLAGVTPPAHCGGQDFSPVMLGQAGPDPAAQLIMVNNFQRNYFRTQLDPTRENVFYPFRGVRTKRYTYVVYAKGDWLLYDNQKDPCQLRNLVNDPAHAEVKAELARELQGWLAKAEDPFIPAEWRALPLPERIAAENRHYSLLPYKKEWDKYKAAALAPYLAGASAAQEKALRAAGDRLCDEAFFGRYKAFSHELSAPKRNSPRPLEEIRAELAAHESNFASLLKLESDKVLQAPAEAP